MIMSRDLTCFDLIYVFRMQLDLGFDFGCWVDNVVQQDKSKSCVNSLLVFIEVQIRDEDSLDYIIDSNSRNKWMDLIFILEIELVVIVVIVGLDVWGEREKIKITFGVLV